MDQTASLLHALRYFTVNLLSTPKYSLLCNFTSGFILKKLPGHVAPISTGATLTLVCPQREVGRWMMALTGLLLLELGLYASCFVCGIVTAASVTIVQVTIHPLSAPFFPLQPLPGALFQCVREETSPK